MARNLAALRSQIETALAGRVIAPFTYRDRKNVETVPTGIPEIDLLTGGLVRGGLTEICGPSCSGRTSLVASALAARTADAEVCAIIDGRDAFDPHSAEAAGVELKQVLWVRCRNIEQALRSADLLLQGGGFGMVALDLSDIPSETVRYVPLNVWFRFRRAVENTPTIFVVLEQEPHAKTCASLVLRMEAEGGNWLKAMGKDGEFLREPQAWLFEGAILRAEMGRSRVQTGEGKLFCSGIGGSDDAVIFETVASGMQFQISDLKFKRGRKA
jgi:recombination protein RecA